MFGRTNIRPVKNGLNGTSDSLSEVPLDSHMSVFTLYFYLVLRRKEKKEKKDPLQ